MAIETQWLLQNRIIWTRFTDEGTIAELRRMGQEMPAYLNAGEERMYWIVDFSHATSPVTDMSAIREALAFLTHPNLYMAVIVGAPNALFKFISSMVAHIYHTQYRNVDTWDEALLFLEEIEALPNAYRLAS